MKAIARVGDGTSTGGSIISSSATSRDNGKQWALNGSHATCGQCKGSFPIYGTAHDTTDDGKAAVLHLDRVLCPCGENRVIAGPDAGCFVEVVDNPSVNNSQATQEQHRSTSDQQPTHSQRIFVWDSSTRQPLANRSWIAEVDGARTSGVTDDSGCATIRTNGSKYFRLHVTFASPKRSLGPDRGGQ
jgi:uncharacterized Zn-binding protein involved in type VI secretion